MVGSYKNATSKHMRIATVVWAMLLLCILLFFAFFIASEVHHECNGEDCPICACIRQCEDALQRMGGGILFSASVIIPALFILVYLLNFIFDHRKDTLVSVKVRLND